MEWKTLEAWLAAGARHGFNPADPTLRAKYFWAVREFVAGRVTGSIDHPAFMAYGELITGWQEQRSRRGPVPLRAGGGMVEALDQVTLLKMMPTLAGPQHDEREPLIIKVQTAAPGVISSLP